MRVPTVHLNGTSGEQLLESLQLAISAVGEAEVAVQGTAPNARDYYPQGPEAFKEANHEHLARMTALHRVRLELAEIGEAVESVLANRSVRR